MTLAARPLRTHQRQVFGLMAALAAGEATGITDVLAAVTPGGGKSLLPVIAGAHLIRAGIVERVCWVVPRDSLRLQAEEAFADPYWRGALNHNLTVRAAENEPDPSRGLAGYVTTYQAIAAAPELHLAEIRRRRTLLVVDELHHLPALSEYEPDVIRRSWREDASAWSRALLPMLESAALRLHLSGTLERADGRAILWLPYRAGAKARTREVNDRCPGLGGGGLLARASGRREGGAARHLWGAGRGSELARGRQDSSRTASRGPASTLRAVSERDNPARPVYGVAHRLRSRAAAGGIQDHARAARTAPGRAGLGAGRERTRSGQAARGRARPEVRASLPRLAPGLDVSGPSRARGAAGHLGRAGRARVLGCLPPHGRALDPGHGGDGLRGPGRPGGGRRGGADPHPLATLARADDRARYARGSARGRLRKSAALVFHPDDPLFAKFRQRIETEQGTSARRPKHKRQAELPLWLQERIAEQDRDGAGGITPLESNALGLRYATLRPGPAFAEARPEREKAQTELIDPPSVLERRLRLRIGEMIAAQVVEDEADLQVPRGQGLYHRYNAVLKRVLGNKGRAEMTLAELEAALAWLERNRLADFLHLLDGDARYAWEARQRAAWRPRTSQGGQGARKGLVS